MREAIWSRALAARVKHNGYFLFGATLGLWIALAAVPLDDTAVPAREAPCPALEPVLADEFEPAHTVRPMPAAGAPRALTRPRYYSTELGMRAPLMAAVLTTEEALESRGSALNATLRSLQPSFRLFTAAGPRPAARAHWPNVVGFTDPRATLTPFHALKYLADNYLDDYHFFFLVSDDTYVNARRLTELVSQLSVSQRVYMGSPASPGSPYCSLSAGVLLSRGVLSQLHAELDWCVRNAYSPHHHENLGRCVLHAAKTPCQSSIQAQQYWSAALPAPDPLLTPALAAAVTARHPAHPAALHRIHAYVSRLHLQSLQQSIRNTSSALPPLRSHHPPSFRNQSWPRGLRMDPSLGPPAPASRWDHARWTPFNTTHGYMLDDHSAVGKLSHAWKEAIDRVVSAACAWMMSRAGVSSSGSTSAAGPGPATSGTAPSCRLQSGAYRWEPAAALRYRLLVDIARDGDDGNILHSVRQMEVALPLGAARLVTVPYVTESARVRMVLPVDVDGDGNGNGDDDHLKRVAAFLRRYTAASANANTHLTVVVMNSGQCPPGSGCGGALSSLRQLVAGAGSATLMEAPPPAAGGPAAPGASLQGPAAPGASLKGPAAPGASLKGPLLARAALEAAARSEPAHSLLLLISADVEYNEDFLNRVRMNSILGTQWYLPVPFARYALYAHPLFVDAKGAKPAQRTGRFNRHHSDVLSVYKADLDHALSACGADPSLSVASLLVCGGPRPLLAPEPGLLRGASAPCAPHCAPRPLLDLGAPNDLAKLLLQIRAQAPNQCLVITNMRPKEGDDVGSLNGSGSGSGDEEAAGDGTGAEEEWGLEEAGGVARAVGRLDALRVARQHYDTVLTASDGQEVPAHRALLAAASPYLLRTLPAVGGGSSPNEPLVCRVPNLTGQALAQLVQWAYSGRLTARGAIGARQLYLAAWTLRFDSARLLLAERLTRRLSPLAAVQARALPDLPQEHQDVLDNYINEHFDEICSSGALSAVPLLRVELVAASSSAGGGEAARAVAEAALQWLRSRHAGTALEQLCARDHLVYVDSGGALRDCDELPIAQAGDRVIQEYRAAAAERGESGTGTESLVEREQDDASQGLVLGTRTVKGEWRVVAARGGGGKGVTRALLLLNGRLASGRVAWREVGAGVAVGGPLGGCRDAAAGGERRRGAPGGRAGCGAAPLGGRLLLCGGYDRQQVLRDAAAYCPLSNEWRPLPPLRSARARFPAVALGGTLYVLGGSDGHNELDSVDVYEEDASGVGRWRAGEKLPLAVSLSGAAVDGAGGVWVVGGWGGGRPLRATHRLGGDARGWQSGPPLLTARSQLSAVRWEDALWALGGCDAWHCLASTERLPLGPNGTGLQAAWERGPALPVARRSVGGAAWRGALWAAGGSDGACSLATCCRLPPTYHTQGQSWLPAPSLRQPRAAAALLPLEEALYAIGGFDGKEFLSSVECLYHPDGEWTSLVVPPPLAQCVSTPGDKDTEREATEIPIPSAPAASNGDGVH